jgi:ABC-type tungstate transport system permease subunit
MARPCTGTGKGSGEVDVVVLGGVVQHGVEVQLVDLGHGADVARHRAGHLDVVLALQHEQVAHLERLAAVAHVEQAVPA